MFALLRRLRARLKYRHFERDLARELEVHRAMKQDELEASGVAPADARWTSVRVLGNVAYIREEARSVWIARWLEGCWQDARYAARQLRRFPAYSAGATLVLAIGVATSTVVFSALNAAFLRPWPVDEADRLILVQALQSADGLFSATSAAEAHYLRTHATTITHLAAYGRDSAVLDGADVQSNAVTASYFAALRVRAILGRLLTEDDGRAGAQAVGLISHHLWETAFQSDPNIVGRTVRGIAGPLTIVGVLEPGFEDVQRLRTDLWVPQSSANLARPVNVVARLADGVDPSRAAIELQALSRQFRRANNLPVPELMVRNTRPINNPSNRGDIRQFLLLVPAIGLLMLLVCANVGGLVLARTSARLRELAVRRALGASRGRVSRQVFTEVLLLALGAGGLGVLGARVLPHLLGDRTRVEQFAPDMSVFLVAIVLSLIAALLAASSALLRVRRISVSTFIARQHGSERSGARARAILIATQLAVSTAVLTGAGLITRAVVHASEADPGFFVDEVQTYGLVDGSHTLRLPAGQSGGLTRRIELAERWRREIKGLGIPRLAFASHRPVSRSISPVQIRKPSDHASTRRQISQRSVSTSYFEVLGIRMLEGRSLSDAAGSNELVVSEKAARRLWPSEPALGQRLVVKSLGPLTQDGPDERMLTVVGVVKDVATRTLGNTEATIYTSCGLCDVVLTNGVEPGVAAQITEAAVRADPGARISHRSARQNLAEEGTSELQDASTAAWIIGLSALALSLIGAFGVLAYTVEERRREIGIRMALGGRGWPVALSVMAAANRPALWGIGAGAATATLVATFLRHAVFGLTPFDPIAYVLVLLALLPSLAVATALPARRATRVDPAITLRHD
jgi:predicted permease